MRKMILGMLVYFSTGMALAQEPTETGTTGKVTFNYRGSQVTYTTVKAKDGRVWLQQNLGAERVGKTISDRGGYGHYFVWGRWDDGHQLRPEPTSVKEGVASPNNPAGLFRSGNNPFYYIPDNVQTNYFWINGVRTDTWSASTPDEVTATNGCDPCKQVLGKEWRLPTKTEWDIVLNTEEITDRESGFASNLKIVLAGYYMPTNHAGGVRNIARLWTSTAADKGRAYIARLQKDLSVSTVPIHRASAYSVRCIKEN